MTSLSAGTDASFVVGIDLGTTHTVVAYADVSSSSPTVHIFPMEQFVDAHVRDVRSLLPSFLYAPLDGECSSPVQAPSGSVSETPATWIVGEFARRRAATLPERVISSSKSWLTHPYVDRTARILPWTGTIQDEPEATGPVSFDTDLAAERARNALPKLSPVSAAAAILGHVQATWNQRFPQAQLAEQELYVTVPASFDEVARRLTLQALGHVGLGHAKLLEEPQAAVLDWAHHQGTQLTQHAGSQVVVVDVGGGTSDFSIISVGDLVGAGGLGGPSLERVAVGEHLLLGGDNVDLALANRLEQKLGSKCSALRFAELTQQSRNAKETLLTDLSATQCNVTLLGQGSRLVGGSRSTVLLRTELEEVLALFFPSIDPGTTLATKQVRSGLVSLGLPYSTDPAITRHLAQFLVRHKVNGPTSLLLNGGVFHAKTLHEPIRQVVSRFTQSETTVLHHVDPDLAVARGAVFHGLSLRGFGPKMSGGSARSYYVAVASELASESASGSPSGSRQALCVLPKGTEPGVSIRLDRTFSVVTGRPARFDLVARTAPDVDETPGYQVDLLGEHQDDFTALAPLTARIQARKNLLVHLEAELTEVGTLEVRLLEVHSPKQHVLSFEVRNTPETSEDDPLPRRLSLPPASLRDPSFDKRLDEARALIAKVYPGKVGKSEGELELTSDGTRDAKQLPRELDKLLGERNIWKAQLIRPMFDVLAEGRRHRRKSPEHERVFWSLAGFLLRPGFGDPGDPERIKALSGLLPQGLAHPKEQASFRAYWIAWRRVVGGLLGPLQTELRDLLDPFLDPHPRKKPKNVLAEPFEEVLLLASSLERLPAERRAELGAWLLERTWTNQDPALYAAVGRLGARVPAYASVHHVVSPKNAETWLAHLLRAPYQQLPTLPYALTLLSRRTGDRGRDISEPVREDVLRLLTKMGAKPAWIAQVREVVADDDESKRAALREAGEDLPLGLRLVE